MEENQIVPKKWMERTSTFFLLGLLLGMLGFISIYGVHILRPSYDDWLLATGGDTGQHYLGWTFFRSAPWHFPPGLHNGLTFPEYTSVLYTDSFPVYALLFKLLSPLLPQTFQYFGIAGCVSFMLQGGFAMLLFRKASKSLTLCGLSSLFFIYSPIMIFRMYAHTSLSSHWLILAALTLWVYSENWGYKKASVLWCLLFFLLPMIHPYFVPMIFLIFCGYILEQVVRRRKVLRYIGSLLSCVFAVVLSLYLVGAFYGDVETTIVQNVDYNTANLNTFWNPLQFTKFLPAQSAGPGQYEGSAYLGAGLLLLCLLALLLTLRQVILKRRANTEYGPLFSWSHVLRPLLLAAVFLFAFILALGTSVTLGDCTLFSYQPPSFILKVWSIFRATGRFIWVSWYILAYAVLSRLLQNSRRVLIGIVLVVCFVVQWFDLTPYMQRDTRFREEIVAETRLTDPAWDVLGTSSSHLFLLLGENPDVGEVLDLAAYAQRYHLTLNDFHFARTFSREEKIRRQSIELENPTKDTVFVFIDQGLSWNAAQQDHLRVVRLNGYLVGIFDGEDEHQLSHLQSEDLSVLPVPMNRSNTLSNGFLEGARRILRPGGYSFGPWWTLPAGSYQLNITGGNLIGVTFQLVRNNVEFLSETSYLVEREQDAMSVDFMVTSKQTGYFEFRLFNSSEEDAWMESMTLQKIE